jgi:hypothetical protein
LFSLRSPLILCAAPAGLVLSALVWMGFGASAITRPLDRLETRLDAIRPGQAPIAANTAHSLAVATAAPLFGLTVGPGAVADPAVRLDGLAISPRGSSALLSVGGKPPAWTELGASRDGITLMEVMANKVVVDTAIGFKEVPLWGGSTGASGGAQATAAAAMVSGTRQPRVVANAPR